MMLFLIFRGRTDEILSGVCARRGREAHHVRREEVRTWERLHVKDGQKRYTDAMSRHLLQDLSGEVYDQESGLHHATAVAWNALARLELTLRELKRVRSE